MRDKKIFVGLLLVLILNIGQAQDKKAVMAPDWKIKSYDFTKPELQVDSTFMERISTLLFNPKNGITARGSDDAWRHIDIQFQKRDSCHYAIQVMLWNTPAQYSLGFCVFNGYFYWFGDEAPKKIILGIKSQRRFSYKEWPYAEIDPPLWILLYNNLTGNMDFSKDKFWPLDSSAGADL